MTFCLGLISIQGLAADRTFTVKSNNSSRGLVRYNISGGSWSAYAGSHSVTAADGATINVQAKKADGNTAYGFSRWYVDVANKPVNYSTNTSFSFTVSPSIAGKSATARFDAWVEDLIAGATYTITNTTTDFTVTCSNTSSPCHNKTYSFIGNVTVKSGKVKIVFNTKKYCLMTGTILVQKGDLEMSLGDGYAFNADHRNTLHRAWGFKGELVKVKPAKRNPGDPANVYTDYKLTIKGKPSDDHSKDFSIFGNYALARMDSTLVAGTVDTYTNYHLVNNDEDMLVNSTLVSLDGGIIDFDYVMVGYNWHTGSQSGIFFGGNGATEGDKIKLEAELDHCLLQWCYGYLYGAACKVDNYVRGSWVRMTDCEVRYCENGNNGDPSVNLSSGGAVRSSGNNLCSLTMTRCYVHHNCTPARGGGIRWNAAMINPSLVLENCVVRRNWAGEYGGGMRVEGQADVTGCSFTDNRAEKSGGGLSLGPFLGGGSAHLYVGGGVWFPKDCSIELDADSKVENNTAVEYGGGIYINVEFTTLEGGTNSGQTFDPWTVYLNDQYEPYKGVLVMNGASVKNNTAGIDGGAVYMTRNTNYYGLVTDLNSGTIDNNTAMGNGGAFCLTEDITVPVSPNPTIFVYQGTTYNLVPQGIFANLGTSDPSVTTDLTMINNTAVNGGGIYVKSGNVSVYGNAVVGGSTANANKSIGGNGGGIFVTGGNLHMYAGEISHNQAKKSGSIGGKGGGTFVDGGDVTIENGNIDNNQADVDGGGLYSSGVVEFSNGSIRNNMASQNGGGIYIPSTGTLNISGTATLTGNNVANGWGGGIYQGGIMTADGESLTVRGNTKGTAKALSANNVYLPDTKTIEVLGDIDPTGVNLGIYTENEAVQGGADIPVLTSTAANAGKLQDIYDALLDGSSRITDDRDVHKTKYPGAALYTLYFTKIAYDFGVFTDSEPFSNPINSPLQLYKYMCWVNGLNGFTEKHDRAEGNVTADINMTGVAHWIPIGEKETSGTNTDAFSGTFNGNGHVISNLQLTGIDGYTNYGLFGHITTDAEINDVFVEGFNFAKSGAGTMGALVGKMEGGTVKNSVASGTMTATHTGCITGGLVGQMTGGTVHSSAAMPDMTGYQMGGLVGDLDSGCNLYNSFANASFTAQSGSTYYIGGLVGVNAGTVENCYSRVRGTIPGATYFGWLAGDNTSGSLVSSYIPTSVSNYTATSKTGTQTSLDRYAPVIAPYLYNRTGDNAVGSSTLLAILNSWVSNHSGYSTWKRTTAGAYSSGAGNINGDYPIHRYKNASDEDLYTCVASTDGVVLDYAANLDAMLTRHTSNATVNLYANDNTSKGTGTNVMVYIDENISLLQSTNNAITAYTCQILPGNTRSWHFVSSSLSNSGIGFTYGQNAPFNWEPNPCHVTISTNDDASLFPSDLPKVGGYSDVSRIDLYCFYEPEYHWINLKRNSDSHWHMNATTTPINYTNETTLTPGKGYLVSADKDLLLQNKGTLNNGDVSVNLGYSPHQEWAGLVGYNLIGNPYQSYLSFTAFANESGNAGLWYDDSKGRAMEPTYAVYDEAMGGYIQYKEGASRGSKSAPDKLNMHQGFMVRSSGATRAKFTNAMRTNDGTSTGIREEQPAFPLINFTVTDIEGVNDFAVLELGRDADAGAEKLRANDCKGWLYLHHNGEDYGILFRTEVDDYQPLWFEAEEEGIYTLSWETANAEFAELTLVDNITGVKTDMLGRDSYVFEADPEQYASRFKIVIGDYKDIEENNEDGPSTGSETFAFQMGDGIVLNGEGRLEVIDMLGRIVRTEQLQGSQSTVRKPETAGVYVLRLMGRDGVRTQKIVIR